MKLTKADKIKLAIIFFGSMVMFAWISTYGIYPVSLIKMVLMGIIMVGATLFWGLIVYSILRLFYKPKKERTFFGHVLFYGFYFILINSILTLPMQVELLQTMREHLWQR